ncbi:MAG: hypothetical protein JNM57_06280 [Cyclobacteriaceae bacterium]|nr:hypothetical protein [Cyclobacteriaceae bacterium]
MKFDVLKSRKKQTIASAIMLFMISTMLLDSCVHDPFLDGDTLNGGEPTTPGCTNGGQVCFESSILPIFISSCARSGCHDATTREEGYVLDSYNNIVRKGISPGNASGSKLYKVLFETGEDQMPPDAPLSQAQKDSIKLWINQGAKNTVDCACYCDASLFAYNTAIKPILENACVGCHKTGSLGGNINLVGYANVKVQVNNGNLMGSIKHATGFVPMPQGSKLPDCDITKIQNWVDAGAPNN